MERGTFSTRLGFILVSAGCAIGLGNVWRFPFITGKYGGASFVLIYLFFLAILGLPIMVAEFAVGRASKRSAALSFDKLEPKGTKWHLYKYGCILGNAMLMMYYTTITGWMFYYLYKMVTGAFVGMAAKDIGGVLGGLVSDPVTMIGYMALAVLPGRRGRRGTDHQIYDDLPAVPYDCISRQFCHAARRGKRPRLFPAA